MLADYHLDNEETGAGAVRQIRARHPEYEDTPVVVITADRSDAIRQEITRLGATRLNKPVKPAKLRALMVYLLED